MLDKSTVQKTIDACPDNFTIDEFIDKLIFMEKVEKGNRQSDSGEKISESELEKEMEKWFE